MNTENGFPNALNPTRISEWKKGTCKGHKYKLICITIQLIMSAITPLIRCKNTSFNLGENDRKTSPNAMKLNKITPND